MNCPQITTKTTMEYRLFIIMKRQKEGKKGRWERGREMKKRGMKVRREM